jgi:hypothetical protein
LEAENSVLKETQFDRAVALLEAQKKAYEIDKAQTTFELARLKQQLDQYAINKDQTTAELARLTQQQDHWKTDLEQIQKNQRQCFAVVVGTLLAKVPGPDPMQKDRAIELLTATADSLCSVTAPSVKSSPD